MRFGIQKRKYVSGHQPACRAVQAGPSAILGESYDVEIIEQHHHNKLDAPSGTALLLADAINEENDGAYHYVYDRSSVRQKRDPKELGISSVRGGSIVGDHEVLFCGPDEVVTLKHTAYSRSVFANGASECCPVPCKKRAGIVQYERSHCRNVSDRLRFRLLLQSKGGVLGCPNTQLDQCGEGKDAGSCSLPWCSVQPLYW